MKVDNTSLTSSVSLQSADDVQIIKDSPKKQAKHKPVGMFTRLGRGIKGKLAAKISTLWLNLKGRRI